MPGWVFRRVCHTLSAVSGWSTPHGWLTACHIQWHNPATRLIHSSSSPHVLTSWDECSPVLPLPSLLPDPLQHLWIWAPASEVPAVQYHFPQMSTVGWFSTSQPIHLMTSSSALDACDSIQIHRLHLLLSHEGSSLLVHQPPPQSANVLRALCIQMSRALSDKNLGRWAALHQLRISKPSVQHACSAQDGSQVEPRPRLVNSCNTPPVRSILSIPYISPPCVCGRHKQSTDRSPPETPNRRIEFPRLLYTPPTNVANGHCPLGDHPPAIHE